VVVLNPTAVIISRIIHVVSPLDGPCGVKKPNPGLAREDTPAPMPWIAQSEISIVGLTAPPSRALLTMNNMMDIMIGILLPLILVSWSNNGCKAEEASTNEFAIQVYSAASPMLSIILGRAGGIIVILRAAIKPRRLKAAIVIQQRKPTLVKRPAVWSAELVDDLVSSLNIWRLLGEGGYAKLDMKSERSETFIQLTYSSGPDEATCIEFSKMKLSIE
jgi:hypothetical protein